MMFDRDYWQQRIGSYYDPSVLGHIKAAWDFLMRQWIEQSSPWVEDLEDCIASDDLLQIRETLQVVLKDMRETRDER